MARPAAEKGKQKEMRFFWRSNWEQRLDWYRKHFDPDVPVRGEATPSYTHYPFLPDVPRRIHLVIPEAKFIYLVRDPIDRIVAHWVQTREDGDNRSLEDALRDLDRPNHPIVCASMYATQVEQYLEFFSLSQLLVLDMNDLGSSRMRVIQEAFRFLGIDDGYESPAYSRELNTREDKRALHGARAALWNRGFRQLGRILPEHTRQKIAPRFKRILSQRVEAPPLAPETEIRLRELLKPEVTRLRQLTGKEFPSWSM